MKYIKSLLSAGTPDSMMRLITLLVTCNIMSVWTYDCFTVAGLADFPNGVVAVLAIVITGKAIQKFGEKKGEGD